MLTPMMIANAQLGSPRHDAREEEAMTPSAQSMTVARELLDSFASVNSHHRELLTDAIATALDQQYEKGKQDARK